MCRTALFSGDLFTSASQFIVSSFMLQNQEYPGTLIIAEAGVNHNGDMQMAHDLIDVAQIAGADVVKFQTFRAAELVTVNAAKADYQLRNTGSEESQLEMLQRLELSPADHEELIRHCNEAGIEFLSTAFDRLSIEYLIELDLPRWKIPSGEVTNPWLLQTVAPLGKPVLLSTGMCTMADIEAAIDILIKNGLDRSMLTLLHCTTEYPVPMAEVNLRAMQTLQFAFGTQVGYSDHTEGLEVAIAAVALGASVIEKHFTLDRTLPGPDHKASLNPMQLSEMTRGIRNIEISLGDGVKRPSESEMRNRSIARKSIVAASAISAGDRFSRENLTFKRPGGGISPMRVDEILGKRANRSFNVDEPIEL